MYYSAIGLLAVLILLIENWGILRNSAEGHTFEKPAWKVYRRFLFAVLAYYITDILWGIIESQKLAVLLFADTTVYYIAMAVGVLFWVQFTVIYLENETKFGRFLIWYGRIIAALITAAAIVNIFVPVLFTVDRDSVYLALPVRYLFLTAQILLLLLISIYAISLYIRHPSGKKQRDRALAFFGLIMAVFLLIQLWFPYLPLYSIAYMLGISMLHVFVVNDELEEYRHGMEEAEKVKGLKQTISSLMDNIPGMTFSKDAETGAYLACNQAFADYAQKAAPEGVIGLTAAQLFNSETAGQIAEDDRITLSMERPYIFYEDLPDDTGSLHQFQTTKLKYYDDTGRLCILGISQDMTDMVRIQHENALTKEAYEKARSTGIIYTHIAQALARGYSDLYYVNLDSEEYIEYRTDDISSLSEVRRGWHFFEQCVLEAKESVYPEDQPAVIRALDRKNLVAALEQNRIFVMTYRLNSEKGPTYVSMRVSRMEDDERYIIMGVTDIDEQMKERRAALRMKEEEIAYNRLTALAGDYLCIYIVDPETDSYREFSAVTEYRYFSVEETGTDFFDTSRKAARRFSHPDDLNRFLQVFTRENVMAEIERHGIFTVTYRIMMQGRPSYIQLKAAMLEEQEGLRLIVGINDVDAQVRQEEQYVRNLAQAQIDANIDALTHVKNRHAYLVAEEQLNQQIGENRAPEFAIVLLDVNDLKLVNDNEGHAAGDQYLRNACRIVCEIFKHSPVFRVGGDEFVVIAQGNDYARIDELVGRVSDQNMEAIRNGGIVIACGMAKYENDGSAAPVFERADQNMYENKSDLKQRREEKG